MKNNDFLENTPPGGAQKNQKKWFWRPKIKL